MDKLASPQQRRMFFSIAHQLGYDAEVVKERAKSKYNLVSFTDITTEQLTPLIDLMMDQMDLQMSKCPHCGGTGYIKKEVLTEENV